MLWPTPKWMTDEICRKEAQNSSSVFELARAPIGTLRVSFAEGFWAFLRPNRLRVGGGD
jgi:hypothetical protein